MKTNYTTTIGFTIIKPKGKKERREQRKALKLLRGPVMPGKIFQIQFYIDGSFRVATGTIEQLRPLVKPIGKYRLPGDSPLIHNGKKAR